MPNQRLYGVVRLGALNELLRIQLTYRGFAKSFVSVKLGFD
jgi:hypothetical protein